MMVRLCINTEREGVVQIVWLFISPSALEEKSTASPTLVDLIVECIARLPCLFLLLLRPVSSIESPFVETVSRPKTESVENPFYV